MHAESNIAHAHAADATSFRGFYREHFGFVWHVVGRFGVAPGEHGDAVQDTFITAFRRIDAIAGGSPRAWLYGIARRVASNYRRGAARAARKHHAARTWMPSFAPQTIEALHTLDRFLDGLDDRDRELFVLAEVLGLTGPEIAAALSIEQRAVYARLRLLRMRLADAIPEGLQAALSRVRADEPSANTRGWFALVPLLHEAPLAAAAGAGAATVIVKLALVGVMVGAVASFVGTKVGSPDGAAAPVTASATPSVDETSQAPASPPASPPPAVSPAASVISSSNAPITVVRSSTPARPTAALEPAVDDGLADDNAVLDAAITALDAGDHARALALIAAHTRRFPASPMRDAAAALRIDALCAAGKTAQARGEARTFAATFPDSPAAARLQRSSCVVKNPANVDTDGSR